MRRFPMLPMLTTAAVISVTAITAAQTPHQSSPARQTPPVKQITLEQLISAGRHNATTSTSGQASQTTRTGSPLQASATTPETSSFQLINVPEGYQLVWHDEFDGTALDTASWIYEVHPAGYRNNELQAYVAGYVETEVNGVPEKVNVTEVADGILTIRAAKAGDKVYSACLNTRHDLGWQYGIFEARIKLPKGKGTWPAFWMKPAHGLYSWPRCGEIDIMEEVGYRPDYTQSAIHCGEYNHTKGNQKAVERNTPGVEDDYHIYSLEWTPDSIITYVDGHPLVRYANDGKGDYMTWPFERPFFLILNLAWGGSWGGMEGVDDSALPAEMKIDYVRVFQNPDYTK